MKTKLLILILMLSLGALKAQESNPEYAKKVATLDSTLETLYGVISGEKGEARDWELFKYLFHPRSQLIFSERDRSGKYVLTYLSPQEYIDRSGKWLVENGFFEVEVSRKEDTFGSITQVFSTYASYRSQSDTEPFMRGINSIQLQNDGDRWYIVNIYWTSEKETLPIPEQYLKGN